jgi:hypothetical protein
MEREAVSSSSVASIGYDPESLTLEVEFASGDVYQYFDVPETEYDGLRVLNTTYRTNATNATGRGRLFLCPPTHTSQ